MTYIAYSTVEPSLLNLPMGDKSRIFQSPTILFNIYFIYNTQKQYFDLVGGCFNKSSVDQEEQRTLESDRPGLNPAPPFTPPEARV